MNLNQYAGSGSSILWHSDNEPLFGPQNLPKLIVSLSLGNSVEFMVRRRASGKVPSSIRLDHGDVLVMDGLAQLEYEHCTASELQGPRVNLTCRWVAQSTSRCCGLCAPNVCARFSRAKFPLVGRRERRGEMVLSLGIGPPFLNPGGRKAGKTVLLVSTWINTRRRHRHSGQRS